MTHSLSGVALPSSRLWLPDWLQRLRAPFEARRRRSPSGGRWRSPSGGRIRVTQEQLEECCCEPGGETGVEICNCELVSGQLVIDGLADSFPGGDWNDTLSNLNGTYSASAAVDGFGVFIDYTFGTVGDLGDPGFAVREWVSGSKIGDAIYVQNLRLRFSCSGPDSGDYTLSMDSCATSIQESDVSAGTMGSLITTGSGTLEQPRDVNIGASCAENDITGIAYDLVGGPDGTYTFTPNFV
jgi:hypothetical protein